jgi:Uma2 family endonuclease
MIAQVREELESTVPSGRVVLHNVSWQRYDALVTLLGDDYPALRLTYLEGTLEIMTTSPYHERLKKMIARLLEMWAVERNVPLNGYGAATFRKEAAERGLEPDECYVLGELVDMPDLAIEVVHTHGGIDKLDVYAGLGVREVWFWEEARFGVHVLEDGRYREVAASALLPALDLDELASFVTRSDQTEAVRAYRDVLARRVAG